MLMPTPDAWRGHDPQPLWDESISDLRRAARRRALWRRLWALAFAAFGIALLGLASTLLAR
ncbi:MAG TPA: hypothetical protein VGS12_13430 [Caulobacteraceae bacterium]|nr:hypothetical protein [Caulobacteraceae bacterium]